MIKYKEKVGVVLYRDPYVLCSLLYVKFVSDFPPTFAWLRESDLATGTLTKREEEDGMKKILRNWKKYITEQEKAGKLVIYCDMDGVLTDFGSTMLNILRKEIKTPCQRNKQFAKKFRDLYGADFVLKRHHMLPDTEYKYIRDMMFNIMNNNSKFWASLPWTDDGKQLWNFLKQFNPCILTAPPDWAAIEGKKQWIRRELGISMSRCFFEEEKYIYASPSALLIDDFKSKTEPFIANGGQAIHHTDAKNTIENLKKLIQQNKVR